MVMITGIWMIYNDIQSQMLTQMTQQHAHTFYHIDDFKNTQINLIKMLAEHPKIRRYDPNERFEAESLFFDTLKAHNEIMQVRLIDLAGKEQIRLDRLRDGTLKRTPLKELQNKADRYYFRKFMTLSEGSVGYSDFDLNIEHGKIDIPFNPTLRLGMPVYENGVKTGTVVINYYMQRWIDNLQRYTGSNFFLVDREGYFLMHPDKEWEWSRYRSAQRKAADYFGLSPSWIENFGNAKYRWIDKNTVAFPLDLYGQKLLAIYRPKISHNELFSQKLLQFSLITLISLILIVAPLVVMIRRYLRRIVEEKAKTKANKAYLATLFDSVFDAVIVIDTSGIIQRVNIQTLRLFGYTAEELIGKNMNILISEPYHSLHEGYVRNDDFYEPTMIGAERNFDALKHDGTLIPISLAVTQMQIENEHFFIGTIRDLSEVKELEKRERSNEMMLIHQSKLAAMGEMLVTIAHQWRQPLNSVGLIIQDLVLAFEHGELDKPYLKTSQKEIMEQLLYMSKTIDEFRNFFALEQTATPCNLIELVVEIRHLYRAQLEASAVSLELLCKHSSGLIKSCKLENAKERQAFSLITYPSEVKQLLLNLISNAKEAIENLSPSDDVRRTITFTLTASEKTIQIDVTDRAGGIDPKVAERIFEPYFTTKKMGTGLGLYICKTLADRHLKAALTFQTDTMEGVTTFSLILPRTIQEADE